jgi:asparagine synthase (glutamine-hydrolysing)
VSVQFGRWYIGGQPADPDFLAKAESMLTPYGPDGGSFYVRRNIGIFYRAFHTMKESRLEVQPHVTESGAVITWDGRLDNCKELVHELRSMPDSSHTDVSIAAAAYEEWGTDCFTKLKGDWALSIWDPNTRSLVLAKDPIGMRPLFYALDKNQVTWSSILDPLVLFAGRSFELDEEYLAGCFSFFPAVHLTPFVGIHSVPPASSVLIRAESTNVTRYWDFDPAKRILYKADAEYEEHFRSVFSQAVRRRLRSGTPVLAELSGGIDSSSVVCMADQIIVQGLAETPRLDTISCYDDSEPSWNEKPYFAMVERKRQRIGCHVRVDSRGTIFPEYERTHFEPLPRWSGTLTESAKQFDGCLISQNNRVVLSGVGGDEILGGVPTPRPELADLLARARFRELVRQLVEWALAKRKPFHQLLAETIRAFFPLGFFGISTHMKPASWLETGFANRHRSALLGYESRLKLFGPLPSFQENISTLRLLQREMACSTPSLNPPYEKRYPYLDQDLIEFVYAVPREQLVRPRQRRSLMRRALTGIVPEEILNRKRKAFVARGPVAAVSADWQRIVDETQHMVTATLGIVNQAAFLKSLDDARHGRTIHVVYMVRTLAIEAWLRHLSRWPIAGIPVPCRSTRALEEAPIQTSRVLNHKSSAS